MIISLIAAMDENCCIGKDNDLPWENLPRDKKRFRDLTLGNPVVMGRKTFESIGKALPKRRNIILTRNKDYKVPKNCEVVHSVDEALELLKDSYEIMIIGGAAVYEAFLPIADFMYLTKIGGYFEGDTYFPSFDSQEWFDVEKRVRYSPDTKNPYVMLFITLERITLADSS